MPTFGVYCDVPDFVQNASMGVEVDSLLGLNTTLSVDAAANSSSLTVDDLTGAPAGPGTPANYPIWLLDGPTSEMVRGHVDALTSTLVLSTPTQVLHKAGTSVSTAGIAGSLADTIRRASRLIENECLQGPSAGDRSLYALSRSEVLRGPGMRAQVDSDYTLVLKPYHFPVQSVTSINIQQGVTIVGSISLSLMPGAPDGGRTIQVPGQTNLDRATDFYATLVYSGGPCTSDLTSVPDDLRQACFLFVADLLGIRSNPTGAADIRRGDTSISTRLRGDKTGHSINIMMALEYLEPYITRF